MSKTIILIPARLESTRLPRKLLLAEDNVPLIQYTFENACKTGFDTFVLGDDREITSAVSRNAGRLVKGNYENGTERIAGAIFDCHLFDYLKEDDVIINVQGDEPLIDPQHIKLASWLVRRYNYPATLCCGWKTESGRELNGNVGVIYNTQTDRAVHFERQPKKEIYFKHIGIYAYYVSDLKAYSELPKLPLEYAMNLEQLRWIENGFEIACKCVPYDGISIDTREDYEEFKRRMKNEN